MIWLPYCGAAPVPDEILGRWNFDPLVLAALLLGTIAYALRGPVGRRRRLWFAGGAGILFLLFVSPFCALTSALFSARVVHHLLLTAAAAPLFVAAWPRERLRIGGGVALWTGVHAVAFWGWHAPPLYAWALSSDAIYWLMQASLAGTAFALWSAVRRTAPLAGAGALLATMVQMGLLGALLTFAGAPLYAPHFVSTIPWGLSPLEDQQLAGLIMWAPGAAFYLAAALVLVGRWLPSEQRTAAVR